MRIFENLRLTTKAITPVIALAIASVGLLIWGFQSSTQTSTDFSGMITHDDVAAVKMTRFSKATTTVPYTVYRLTAYACTKGEAASCNKALTDFKDSVSLALSNIDDAIRIDPDQTTHRAAMDDLKSRFNALAGEIQTAVDLALKDDDSGTAILKSVDPKFIQLSADVTAFNDKAILENEGQARDISVDARFTNIKMLLIGLGTMILGLAFAVWLSVTQVSRPLVKLGAAMRDIAQGDLEVELAGQARADEIGGMSKAVQVFKENAMKALALQKEADLNRSQVESERRTNEQIRAQAAEQQALVVDSVATGMERLSSGDLVYRLTAEFAPEYEKLRSDFNNAMTKLHDTMKVVADNAAAIRSGTAEISTASNDLSRRTEQQAASLEETAAALDEITATVKKTSDGSIHARKVVAGAKSDAENSGEVVGQAVEAMDAIEQSADKISQIIGVIDEIAFQTNLLALNAGVEAARAGEAGRGFAVVASEVRALAQRSAEAAKEIKALISTSSQQVGAGVDLVSKTGHALQRIVSQITEINEVVSDIATSTQEQATALQEVNTAINQMDQVTQQNAAMVEESTAASRNLSQETEELARLIGQFQLDNKPSGTSSHVPSSKARIVGPSTAMKTVGRGGAARKLGPATQNWEEF